MNLRYLLITLLFLSGCNENDRAENIPEIAQKCVAWSGGKSFGTTGSDEALDVVIDASGNLYLAGYENGTVGQTNIEPSGSAQGVIFTFDRSGALTDKTTLNSTGASTIEALAFRPQTGELYLAGRTNGALPGYSNSGQYDLLVGWLSPDPSQTQLFQYGNERPQHPVRLALGPSEAVVVAGYDDVYVPTNYVAAWENPLLTTFTRSGATLTPTWNYNDDTVYSDAYNGLTVSGAADGALYVTGRSDGVNDRGISVSKYSPSGATLWKTRLTNISYDNGAAVERMADGNLLVAGSTFSQLGTQQYGQMDIVVVKLDQLTGAPLWAVQYGSTETDWVTDMAIDVTTGNIYVIGETFGVIETGQTNPDQNAIFLVKLDATGKVILARQWNSGALDVPTAVAVDKCGQAYIAGYTTGNLIGANQGSRDGFVFQATTQVQ